MMIGEKFRVRDDARCRAMKGKYLVMLNNYNKLSENLMKNYLTLKEKDDYLTIIENKLSARIKELYVSENRGI